MSPNPSPPQPEGAGDDAASRWRRVDEIFQKALELDLEQQDSFLAEACGADAGLRREVESLLKAHQQAESFLEEPAAWPNVPGDTSATPGRVPDLVPPVQDEESLVGQRLGAYELVRRIASGGMGTVYLGVRADRQFEQQVAIKVVKRGLDTDEVIRRFRSEQQTLARLDHPNIARLFDGGVTPDGRPYLVMEHVEGEPIDAHCDRARLSVPKRLRLFRAVCEAVQYAHRNLIVHRDLKPGNILVTSEGTPKLLDFGIAKLLDPQAGGESVAATRATMRLMTPEYSSPEQVLGEVVTTATDVYLLGLLLYELLTGRRPFAPPAAGGTIERAAHESAPARPSSVVMRSAPGKPASDGATPATHADQRAEQRDTTPDKLRRRLAGDLDKIVLCALARDPARRYASVEQFSDDVRRHLDRLPVLAQGDRLFYLSAKFVRRHLAGVAATALVLAALLAGIIGTTWQARIARREAETAREVCGFLTSLFRVADPFGPVRISDKPAHAITAREILDSGAERIRDELRDRPLVRATLMHTIGRVYQSLGLYEEAALLLDEALDIRLERLGQDNLDTAATMDRLGTTLPWLAQPDRAVQLVTKALEIRRRILDPRHPDVATSLNNLGWVHHRGENADAAEPYLREALQLRRELFGDEHLDVTTSLNNLASVLWTQKSFADAIPLFEESLTIRRRLLGANHPWVASTLHNLAASVNSLGDFETARTYYEEALAIRRELLPEGHPKIAHTLYAMSVAFLGRAEAGDDGRAAQAEPLLRECLDIRTQALAPDHWWTADTKSLLADCLIRLGQLPEAERLLRESIPLLRAQLGDGHEHVQEALARWCKLHERLHRPCPPPPAAETD